MRRPSFAYPSDYVRIRRVRFKSWLFKAKKYRETTFVISLYLVRVFIRDLNLNHGNAVYIINFGEIAYHQNTVLYIIIAKAYAHLRCDEIQGRYSRP